MFASKGCKKFHLTTSLSLRKQKSRSNSHICLCQRWNMQILWRILVRPIRKIALFVQIGFPLYSWQICVFSFLLKNMLDSWRLACNCQHQCDFISKLNANVFCFGSWFTILVEENICSGLDHSKLQLLFKWGDDQLKKWYEIYVWN